MFNHYTFSIFQLEPSTVGMDLDLHLTGLRNASKQSGAERKKNLDENYVLFCQNNIDEENQLLENFDFFDVSKYEIVNNKTRFQYDF